MTRPGTLAAVAAAVLLVASTVGWSRVEATAPAPTGGQLDGALLFRIKGCAQCHDGPDTHSQMIGFPDLSGARDWAGLRRANLGAAQYIRQSIRNPSAFSSPAWTPSGGQFGMPKLAVSDAEVDALVRYLLSR